MFSPVTEDSLAGDALTHLENQKSDEITFTNLEIDDSF